MIKESLILTGFMGVGKSTIGRKAAGFLGMPYYDTDEWIEQGGIDIPQLVKTDMAAFRKIEAEALKDIAGRGPGIISTGGGIVSAEIGRNVLKAVSASVIWLRAPFSVSVARVAEDHGRERPLFADTLQAFKLYDQRSQWYEETADHVVDASLPISLVAGEIVKIAR